LARNFPVRNRIIAALARAVLIVEAGEQSGSLITAGCAQTYGRTLLALPGNIDQPESVGGNRLIQSGQARLVLDASDVLAGLTGRPPQPLVKGPRPPARKLLRRPRRTPGPGIAQGHLPSPPQAASAPPAQGAPEVATRALPAPLPDGPPGRLLGALRDGPRHPDDLAQAAGLAIEQTLGLLLELELSGEIVQTSEHTFALP
jgi:DNA processing protein